MTSEHPDSSSMVIRMWHSAVMQNATGRVGASYQYHAEAAFLAQRLHLHDEKHITRSSPIESKLLRTIFWLLFLADKTAVAQKLDLPSCTSCFDGGLTLLSAARKTSLSRSQQ